MPSAIFFCNNAMVIMGLVLFVFESEDSGDGDLSYEGKG